MVYSAYLIVASNFFGSFWFLPLKRGDKKQIRKASRPLGVSKLKDFLLSSDIIRYLDLYLVRGILKKAGENAAVGFDEPVTEVAWDHFLDCGFVDPRHFERFEAFVLLDDSIVGSKH